MDKKDIEKLQNLAKSFRRMGAKVKLIALLDKAKEEFDKNNYAQCIMDCEKILIEDENNSVALRGIGCALQASGNFEKAIGYYERALEFSENKEIENTLIGTVYYLQDDLERALKYYNKAIDINESYDLAYEGRNQAMLENHLQILDLQDSHTLVINMNHYMHIFDTLRLIDALAKVKESCKGIK